MTLEEAIKHCEEKSCGNNACALEHKQLSEWLKELKKLRSQTTWKPSDKQIEMLENVRKILHTNKDIYSEANNLMYNLEELIRTLKKLREE